MMNNIVQKICPFKVKDQHTVRQMMKADDRALIDQLYLRHKSEFMSWANRKFSCGKEDILDCWQDTIIAFYEQGINGKLEQLKVSYKTYLFAIGKYKMLNRFRGERNRKLRNLRYLNEQELYWIEEDCVEQKTDSLPEHRERLQKCINQLSPKAKKLLIDRFYHQLSIEEMRIQGEYRSRCSVSAGISRALKNLKELMKAQA